MQQEREKIARDLQEHIGAQLTNVISGLDMMGKYSPATETRGLRLLKSLKEDARVSILQLRETIWAIKSRSTPLDKFAAQVREYSHKQLELQDEAELFFESDCDGSFDLTPVQVLNCFRIVQEALTNCVKHGRAENIFLDVRSTDDGRLEIRVKDDGVRSRSAASRELHGDSIISMKRRAEEIGGELSVRSIEERGTELKVTVPLGKKQS